jgi:hypothetical protein
VSPFLCVVVTFVGVATAAVVLGGNLLVVAVVAVAAYLKLKCCVCVCVCG